MRPNDESLFRDDAWKCAVILAAVLYAFFCFYYQIKHPPCCDADGYLRMATRYAVSGISPVEVELDPLRLYGYPYFISLIIRLATVIGFPHLYMIFIAQLTFYIGLVVLLSRLIAEKFSQSVSNAVFGALLCNIVVYPYLAIVLTDGFTAVLVLAIAYVVLAILVGIMSGEDVKRTAWSYGVLGLLVGFEIMVRPAGVYMLAFLGVIVALGFKYQAGNKLSSMLVILLATVIGFFVSVTPQVMFNYEHFKQLTFMPVVALGTTQLDWGINVLKYLTNLSGGGLQMCYKSPWVIGTTGQGLGWYFSNPVAGLKTMFVHLYGVLDYDYLFPYVYKLNIKYRFLLFLFSQFVLYWGVAGFFYASATLRNSEVNIKGRYPGVVWSFFALSIASFVLGWSAVHVFPGSENRWSLPVVVVLLPLAVWVVFCRLGRIGQHRRVWLAFALYLGMAALLSAYIGELKGFC